MGRCYEFGVTITEGCDHAMVVPATGGRCVCVGCATSCPGRFAGCDAVISQPGYVPAMAPEWALQVPEAAAEEAPVPASPPVPDDAGRPPYGALSDPIGSSVPVRGDVLIDLIEDLGKQIAARDTELGTLFDRFVDEFRKLRAEVVANRTVIDSLEQRVRALTARVDEVLPATLLGPVRTDT